MRFTRCFFSRCRRFADTMTSDIVDTFFAATPPRLAPDIFFDYFHAVAFATLFFFTLFRRWPDC